MIEKYNYAFNDWFDTTLQEDIEKYADFFNKFKRYFFVGNGGSNAIASHMAEDFSKILKKPTFSFSDAALITCLSNDYGYNRAILEWLNIHFNWSTDLLIAISSSGESNNIYNAALYASKENLFVLSGFQLNNKLNIYKKYGIHIRNNSYGVVECLHQTILHVILDELQKEIIHEQ